MAAAPKSVSFRAKAQSPHPTKLDIGCIPHRESQTAAARRSHSAAPESMRPVPIAITDDHRALADSVSQLLSRRDARAAARALIDAPAEDKPPFWADLISLGLTGLHVPEEYGGAGGDLTDLVVAVEELGS